jgi:hypothetical protein
MTKYCYLSRPMASYGIPGTSMLPPDLYQELMEQGYTFLDPAFDLESGDIKFKGNDPWIKMIQLHCDRLVVIISGGITTCGVNAEIQAAMDVSIPVDFPYGTPKRSLSISDSATYNNCGAFILSSTSRHSRFIGFTASLTPIDPRIPIITPGQD